jgi:hypothetical protein
MNRRQKLCRDEKYFKLELIYASERPVGEKET